MTKLITQRHTHPLIWLAAIFCTVVAIAVIIAGVVIFVGYLAIRPKLPYISITYAHLDRLDYDQTGQFSTQITLEITATDENTKAHARFSALNFLLRFHQVAIAELRAEEFDVVKNSTLKLEYVIQSSSIPLEPRAQDEMETSLRQDKISFQLKGETRTRWNVGPVRSVKFWTHLSCQLDFIPSNGSSISPLCSSKGH
ncbi:uncharacterized protein LOC131247856 [Magnolia sinica]|uniref:uncharacterized protein LOC131247856 n=1 Tax=Magnolia sinica TaxID=86752 RepID=UPI002657F725|nr:uncharacterized protein LOC131247856 [Magnolia sinica]